MATPPSAGAYDVVVVGSGSAGSPAAIGAARGGSRTLLIEKLLFLGGNSTAVLDTFYGFVTPGERLRKVVAGIADEVVDELRRLSEVVSRQNTYGAGIRVTYAAERLKVVWERLVTAAGARVMLHSFLQGEAVSKGRVVELVVATKGGLRWLVAGFAEMLLNSGLIRDDVHRMFVADPASFFAFESREAA